MQTVSATDLALHSQEILDRVAARGETVAIERNAVVIAYVVPAQRAMTVDEALAGLQPARLTGRQAAAWLVDSRGGFDETARDPLG